MALTIRRIATLLLVNFVDRQLYHVSSLPTILNKEENKKDINQPDHHDHHFDHHHDHHHHDHNHDHDHDQHYHQHDHHYEDQYDHYLRHHHHHHKHNHHNHHQHNNNNNNNNDDSHHRGLEEEEEIQRCGSHDPDATTQRQSDEYVKRWKLEHGGSSKVGERTTINIPVAFHVIYYQSYGVLTQTDLTNSLNVMNLGFANSGIQFYQSTATYTDSFNWFYANINSFYEVQFKSTLKQGGATTLNVYFNNGGGGGILGYATFPWLFSCDTNDDGVVVRSTTVPGGSTMDYDEGDTLTHEVGHWLGLFHVFQGNSCYGDGDYVADTPAQSSATIGCPASKDSCPNVAGSDSINNFMDYSWDRCLDSFTNGQITRMAAYWDMRLNPIPCGASFGAPSNPPTPAPVQPTQPPTSPPTQPPTSPPTLPPTQPYTGPPTLSPPTGPPTLPPTQLSTQQEANNPTQQPQQPQPQPQPEILGIPLPEPSCFAPNVTTQVLGKGSTMMKDIMVGDKVLTADGTYKMIYTIDHFHPTKPTQYLQIHTTGTNTDSQMDQPPLELTPGHLLFVMTQQQQQQQQQGYDEDEYSNTTTTKGSSSCSSTGAVTTISYHPIPASHIKVGDMVQSIQYGPIKVIDIQKVTRNGLYNPITIDGTIVVAGGLVASTYTSLPSASSSYYHYHSSNGAATVADVDNADNNNNNFSSFIIIFNIKLLSIHNMIHMACIPYRVYCTTTTQRCNQHQELSSPSEVLQYLYMFWLKQSNDIIKFSIFLAYVLLLAPICLICTYCMKLPVSIMMTIASLICFYRMINNQCCIKKINKK